MFIVLSAEAILPWSVIQFIACNHVTLLAESFCVVLTATRQKFINFSIVSWSLNGCFQWVELPGYGDIKHRLLFCVYTQGHLEHSSPPPFHPPSLAHSLLLFFHISKNISRLAKGDLFYRITQLQWQPGRTYSILAEVCRCLVLCIEEGSGVKTDDTE